MERELKKDEVEETLDIFQDPAITAEEERKYIREFEKMEPELIRKDPEYRALLKELGLL
ncbi:hypothetical protein [Ligilactobacillus saerimneri]|uniref:hypothetical protein n=1 Tax=Ligilactobacillus saerimneri TaxID=228229 RepID=UPI0024B24547|nr:hypothetical protein [Ligilactobacillus saerimneri]MDI9205887.1 hypothetical protein [Ligilactobacillus saerimneri]